MSIKNSDEKQKNDHLKKLIKKAIKDNKKHIGKKSVKNTEGNIIDFYNVEKIYTNKFILDHVLKNITFSIKKGDFVVFLGKSGSGKTTLMNIMSGLMRATNGTTIVADTNLINLSDSELTYFRRKNIGYIFQEYGLLETLTVYENVLSGYNLNKNNADKGVINSLLNKMGLLALKNKYPMELSGGQQQRVAIARAIAKNPKIIFGDEPTGALDSKMSEIILSMLKQINQEKKTTIIIITHDKEIARLADTVFVVNKGKIEEMIKN